MCFTLKDIGSLCQFLDIEVYRDTTRLYLTQAQYVIDLLKKFSYDNLKPSLTPIEVGKLIFKTEG